MSEKEQNDQPSSSEPPLEDHLLTTQYSVIIEERARSSFEVVIGPSK